MTALSLRGITTVQVLDSSFRNCVEYVLKPLVQIRWCGAVINIFSELDFSFSPQILNPNLSPVTGVAQPICSLSYSLAKP